MYLYQCRFQNREPQSTCISYGKHFNPPLVGFIFVILLHKCTSFKGYYYLINWWKFFKINFSHIIFNSSYKGTFFKKFCGHLCRVHTEATQKQNKNKTQSQFFLVWKNKTQTKHVSILSSVKIKQNMNKIQTFCLCFVFVFSCPYQTSLFRNYIFQRSDFHLVSHRSSSNSTVQYSAFKLFISK